MRSLILEINLNKCLLSSEQKIDKLEATHEHIDYTGFFVIFDFCKDVPVLKMCFIDLQHFGLLFMACYNRNVGALSLWNLQDRDFLSADRMLITGSLVINSFLYSVQAK